MKKTERFCNIEFRDAPFPDMPAPDGHGPGDGEHDKPNGPDERKNILAGVASVFNSPADFGEFEEYIEPHAFDECDMSDVILNFNHNDSLLLAGTRNASMRLFVDYTVGLCFEANVIETTLGEDAMKLVRSGLISKMSFAFVVAPYGSSFMEDPTGNGKDRRVITKIAKLYDCSLVTFPAYPQTSVYARMGEDAEREYREYKRSIQDKKMKEIIYG